MSSDFGGSYWRGYLSDTGKLVLSPLHWSGTNWLEASLVAGVAAGLYSADPSLESRAQKNRSSTTNRIAELAKPFGDGRFSLPPLAALYVYGYFAGDSKARETVRLGLESFILSGASTSLLKALGHRSRPGEGGSARKWDGPGFGTDHLSFPSGHSTVAFAVATTLATEYGNHKFVAPACYTLASLTALSRVNDNAHWASDVFAGSAIGYLTAREIEHLHHHTESNYTQIVPVIRGDECELVVSHRF